MIVDAVLGLILPVIESIMGTLPDAEGLGLPAIQGFVQLVAELDSLIPILPVVQVALAMLSALIAFVVIRLVLVVVNIVWW